MQVKLDALLGKVVTVGSSYSFIKGKLERMGEYIPDYAGYQVRIKNGRIGFALEHVYSVGMNFGGVNDGIPQIELNPEEMKF